MLLDSVAFLPPPSRFTHPLSLSSPTHSVIAVVEVVNSSGIQIQANGAVPSITVDKTSGVTIFVQSEAGRGVSDDVRYRVKCACACARVMVYRTRSLLFCASFCVCLNRTYLYLIISDWVSYLSFLCVSVRVVFTGGDHHQQLHRGERCYPWQDPQ